MKHIHVISASAGTGKTYRLTQDVLKWLGDPCHPDRRPEHILATTFTNKAADELKARIRSSLIQNGQVEQAQGVDAAMIGTVNAICGRLVGDFAFDLGLSPRLSVLDEDAAKTMLAQVVSQTATAEELTEVTNLSECFADWDWQATVRTMVTKARANNMGPGELAHYADESWSSLKDVLPPATTTYSALKAKLHKELSRFEDATGASEVKKTQEVRQTAAELLASLERGDREWALWNKIVTAAPAKADAEALAAAQELAARHICCSEFAADCEQAIRLMFSLAAKALQQFQQRKAEAGVLDFTDQEVLALELLGKEAPRRHLQERLRLVMVDEFQDTSPIQLAIFLKMAELVPENIWVGDQKQAIYGFRDTDPTLMDAVIEQIAGKGMETLAHSYRSRKDLVDATSALFAEVFPKSGIPAKRVSITMPPDNAKESAGLGPVFEHWTFNVRNKSQEIAALAAGIDQFLNDKDVMVREKDSGVPRPVRMGDVAVLCRGNAACDAIAAELAKLGRASRRETGLLFDAPEVRVLLAGLRYFVDDHDSLALAELAQLTQYGADGNALLKDLLKKERAGVLLDLPTARRIREAAKLLPVAGVLAAFDAVSEAVQIQELCLQWGCTASGLENVDALRALAARFVVRCEGTETACTTVGFLADCADIEKRGEDAGWASARPDAVTVSTWHGSKGREWPVVILFELGSEKEANALGVHVLARDRIDVADPLAGRRMHFWPNPYNSRTKNAAFVEHVTNCQLSQDLAAKLQNEDLRLLYVIWTRARDRLILATKADKPATAKGKKAKEDGEETRSQLGSGILRLLSDDTGRPLLVRTDRHLECLKIPYSANMRQPVAMEVPAAAPVPGTWYACAERVPEYPPAHTSPSSIEGTATIGTPATIGARMELRGNPEMVAIGMAVHGFLAADRPDYSPPDRLKMAETLLANWGVPTALAPQAVVTASDNLRKWIEAHWPQATWRREWPLTARLDNGSILRGTADLVLETDAGFVLLDHKSYPGSQEQATRKAADFGGQLNAYAKTLSAALNKPMLGCFIHMPINGLVLPVKEMP